MPQCMGFKADKTRCSKQGAAMNLLPHLHFCSIHAAQYRRRVANHVNHREGQCLHFLTTHRWCPHAAHPGMIECVNHFERGEVAANRVNLAIRNIADINMILAPYNVMQPLLPWRQVAREISALAGFPIFTRRDAARIYFRNVTLVRLNVNFLIYWEWLQMGAVGAEPELLEIMPPLQPHGGLAGFVRDAQNVHTAVVSEQTNAGLQKLLAKGATARPHPAPNQFASRWLLRTYGDWGRVANTVDDMVGWYNTQSCRTANDYLYRNALNGLYLIIRDVENVETRTEIFKRVFEEAYESIGMCCEGHISRLCNVLVGFDAAFAPPVPFGEILQNKMAAIHAMDIDTEAKVKQANDFFDEHKVVAEDRVAWLDAF